MTGLVRLVTQRMVLAHEQMKQYSNRNTNVMGITRNQKQQDPYSAAAQTILTWLGEQGPESM